MFFCRSMAMWGMCVCVCACVCGSSKFKKDLYNNKKKYH